MAKSRTQMGQRPHASGEIANLMPVQEGKERRAGQGMEIMGQLSLNSYQ
jgi:hypothetical protein